MNIPFQELKELEPLFFKYKYKNYGIGVLQIIPSKDSDRIVARINACPLLMVDDKKAFEQEREKNPNQYLVSIVGGYTTWYQKGQTWNIASIKDEWYFTKENLNSDEFAAAVVNSLQEIIKLIDEVQK